MDPVSFIFSNLNSVDFTSIDFQVGIAVGFVLRRKVQKFLGNVKDRKDSAKQSQKHPSSPPTGRNQF